MGKFILVLFLVGLFLSTRFVFLNSGIYFYEPDEWSWDASTASFAQGFIPTIAGRWSMDQIPLFEVLAHLVSFVVKDSVFPRTFLDIRLVSAFASGVVVLVLFRYLQLKVSTRAGLFGASLFILTPLSLFYSRYGGREMLLILFSLLFYWSWENLRKSPTTKKIVLTGVLLGLTIYSKLTGLIFLAVPGLYFLTSFFKGAEFVQYSFNEFKLKISLNKQWYQQAKANFLIGTVALFLVFLAFLPFALVSQSFFKDRLYLVLFAHGSGSIFDQLQVLNTYLTRPVYWLSLTVVILVILGVVWILKNGVRKWQDLIFFTLLTLGFLVTNESRARYFAVSLPFLTIFAALGLGYSTELVKKRFKLKNLQLALPVLILLTTLPSSWKVIESTNHSGFENAVKTLKEKEDGRMVFSSYWPPIIQYISGLPTVRLTDKIEDATRDSGEYPLFSPNVAVPPTQLLDAQQGAWVLIHEPVERDEFSERKRAIAHVMGNYDYFFKVSDGKPNFPETDHPYTLYLFDTANKRTQ